MALWANSTSTSSTIVFPFKGYPFKNILYGQASDPVPVLSGVPCFILQEDFISLGQWEADWQMKFNVAKCHSMSDSASASQTDTL